MLPHSKEQHMKTGFTVGNIEVLPENDYRHLNPLIDASDPQVREYLISLEDHITYLTEQLLNHEPDNTILREQLELDRERNERTRLKG
jgi:hypothetical protein